MLRCCLCLSVCLFSHS
uniref:Uncharacterized protein n=1 Tax=Anguilla anguilla TaxID=7936 RepID=A0A0E9UST1_ANGAN